MSGLRSRRLKVALSCAALLTLATAVFLRAQSTLTADGVIESTIGGFKFPDGTVQTTAFGASGLAPVADTGQQACWDTAGNLVSCPGTGHDGETQAGVDWPAPRFTALGDGTVIDDLTGLVWLESANCFGMRTWTEALADAEALSSGSCGLTDGSLAGQWRLPNLQEMHSLVDYSQANPPLPPSHPFTGVQSEFSFYWTSTTVVRDPRQAWIILWADGNYGPGGKSLSEYVWPVRGGR